MKSHDQPIFDFREFFGASGEAVKAGLVSFHEIKKLTFDVWLQLGAENLRFVSARFDAQAGLLDGLCGCADPGVAGEEEARFLAQSVDEYRKVFSRMGEITREAGDRILAFTPGPARGRKAA